MAFSLHQLTALHIAAERGYIEILEYLVVEGADIDIQDNEDKVTIFDYSTDQYCIAFSEFESATYVSLSFWFWEQVLS